MIMFPRFLENLSQYFSFFFTLGYYLYGERSNNSLELRSPLLQPCAQTSTTQSSSTHSSCTIRLYYQLHSSHSILSLNVREIGGEDGILHHKERTIWSTNQIQLYWKRIDISINSTRQFQVCMSLNRLEWKRNRFTIIGLKTHV